MKVVSVSFPDTTNITTIVVGQSGVSVVFGTTIISGGILYAQSQLYEKPIIIPAHPHIATSVATTNVTTTINPS